MEIVAFESNLIKGMVEQLPLPGSVFPEEARAKWLGLMGQLLELVYSDGPLVVDPATVSSPTPPAPPQAGGITVLESRVSPRSAPSSTAFGERLASRKAATPVEEAAPAPVASPSPRKALPAPANAVPADTRAGKPKARDMILAVLGESRAPLRLKEIVAAAEKKYKGHGFKNLYGAIGFQVSRMDGKEIEWDEGLHGKVWKLVDS